MRIIEKIKAAVLGYLKSREVNKVIQNMPKVKYLTEIKKLLDLLANTKLDDKEVLISKLDSKYVQFDCFQEEPNRSYMIIKPFKTKSKYKLDFEEINGKDIFQEIYKIN